MKILLFAILVLACDKTVPSGIVLSGKPKSGIGVLHADSTLIITSLKRRTCGLDSIADLIDKQTIKQ